MDPRRAHHRRGGEQRAEHGGRGAGPAPDGDDDLGEDQAEEDAGDQRGGAVELVLAEQEGAKGGDRRPHDGGGQVAHGRQGSVPAVARPGHLADAARDGQDWTARAADGIERVVTGIRDKTTVPLTTIARALVFGLLAAVMGTATLVLVAIGSVRAVDNYLPGDVWAAHLLVGGIFTAAGGFLLRKATARGDARRKGSA